MFFFSVRHFEMSDTAPHRPVNPSLFNLLDINTTEAGGE